MAIDSSLSPYQHHQEGAPPVLDLFIPAGRLYVDAEERAVFINSNGYFRELGEVMFSLICCMSDWLERKIDRASARVEDLQGRMTEITAQVKALGCNGEMPLTVVEAAPSDNNVMPNFFPPEFEIKMTDGQQDYGILRCLQGQQPVAIFKDGTQCTGYGQMLLSAMHVGTWAQQTYLKNQLDNETRLKCEVANVEGHLARVQEYVKTPEHAYNNVRKVMRAFSNDLVAGRRAFCEMLSSLGKIATKPGKNLLQSLRETSSDKLTEREEAIFRVLKELGMKHVANVDAVLKELRNEKEFAVNTVKECLALNDLNGAIQRFSVDSGEDLLAPLLANIQQVAIRNPQLVTDALIRLMGNTKLLYQSRLKTF